jgi:DNA-binding winged helix-turn-helix (wHTH) protein
MRQSGFAFGPFRLLLPQRLLLEGEQPVHLGSRALDILIALVERPGELVNKRELMARVWPNMVVVEGNLTVHVAMLRRAIRDGQTGNRYLINIPGQGYRFVAHVALLDDTDPIPQVPKSSADGLGLPARTMRPHSADDASRVEGSLRVLSAVASALGLEIWTSNTFADLNENQIRQLLEHRAHVVAATGFAGVAAPNSADAGGGNSNRTDIAQAAADISR